MRDRVFASPQAAGGRAERRVRRGRADTARVGFPAPQIPAALLPPGEKQHRVRAQPQRTPGGAAVVSSAAGTETRWGNLWTPKHKIELFRALSHRL